MSETVAQKNDLHEIVLEFSQTTAVVVAKIQGMNFR